MGKDNFKQKHSEWDYLENYPPVSLLLETY